MWRVLLAGVAIHEVGGAAFSGDGHSRSPLMRAESNKQPAAEAADNLADIDAEETEEGYLASLSKEEIEELHNTTLLTERIKRESDEAEKAGFEMSTGLHYRRRRVLKPGQTVIFHNHIHRRYIRSRGTWMDSSAVVAKPWYLPDTWTWERWNVVGANRRRGSLAFHSRIHNRFMKMAGHSMTMSPWRNDWQLPAGWAAERFWVYQLGSGYIGLWGVHARKWACMAGHRMKTLNLGWHRLPNWRTWERFGIVTKNQLLKPGDIVALHGPSHNRFVRMHGWYADTSPKRNWNTLPAGWTWERFTVIDAGHGEVALYNKIHKRFLRVGGHQVSAVRSTMSLPRGWTWERFSVVNVGGGYIALHNAAHNRYLRMNNRQRIDFSPKRSATTFPGGWWWERFRVIKCGRDPLVLTETFQQEIADLLAEKGDKDQDFNETMLEESDNHEPSQAQITDTLSEPEAEPGYENTPPEPTEFMGEVEDPDEEVHDAASKM